jgi:uncharacterized protein YbaR (Trm112 family)
MTGEIIICPVCKQEKEILYKDDEVVAEKCHCKDIKTVGIKPLDKAMEILNENNRRSPSISTKPI